MFLMSFSLLLALLHLHFVHTFSNITIDDTNTTAIQYTPQSCLGGINEWPSSTTALAYDGSLRWCNDPNAVVIFPFTGVAVYFLSPLWPYQMTMSAKLDNSISGIINVTDPNAPTSFNGPPTVSSSVVWSSTGLANGPHTLVLSGANSMNGYHNLNVDGFIYTVIVEENLPSSSASITSTGSASSTSPSVSNNSSDSSPPTPPSSSSSSSHKLAIAFGVLMGGLALTFLVYIFRRHQARAAWARSNSTGVRASDQTTEYQRVPDGLVHSLPSEHGATTGPLPRSTRPDSSMAPPSPRAFLANIFGRRQAQGPWAHLNSTGVHASDQTTGYQRTSYGLVQPLQSEHRATTGPLPSLTPPDRPMAPPSPRANDLGVTDVPTDPTLRPELSEGQPPPAYELMMNDPF